MATINFSLAGVRLLIKGGSYSRTALIILEQYMPLPSIKIAMRKTMFQDFSSNNRYDRKMSSHTALEPSQGLFLPCFCLELMIVHRLWSWPRPLIVFAHACSYYSRAATISFTELQVRLLFEGSYCLGCAASIWLYMYFTTCEHWRVCENKALSRDGSAKVSNRVAVAVI